VRGSGRMRQPKKPMSEAMILHWVSRKFPKGGENQNNKKIKQKNPVPGCSFHVRQDLKLLVSLSPHSSIVYS